MEEKKVSLKQRGFTRIYVREGQNEIAAYWGSAQKNSTILLEIQENNTYYINLKGVSRATFVQPGGVSQFNLKSELVILTEDEAKNILGHCCGYQEPSL